MSSKKGKRQQAAPLQFSTIPGVKVELTDDLVGRRILVRRVEQGKEDFEGLVDGRIDENNYLIDFKKSKYLKKRQQEGELNAMEVIDLSDKENWKLMELKGEQQKEHTYSQEIPVPMPKGGCPEGQRLMKESENMASMRWQRVNVMWDTGNVFSGFIVDTSKAPLVKVVYDDDDREEIDLTQTCWRLITSGFEHMEMKDLTKFQHKLMKEFGDIPPTPPSTSAQQPRRGRSQQTSAEHAPTSSNKSKEARNVAETQHVITDQEGAAGSKKRNKRKATTSGAEPETKKVKDTDDEQKDGRPQRTASNQNNVGTRTTRQAAAAAAAAGGSTEVQNGGGSARTTPNHRHEMRTMNAMHTEEKPPYIMLVDDRELKVIKFPATATEPTMYDMVLVLPGISKENVAVECGDFSVRVSIDQKDENTQNRNNDADGEGKAKAANGVSMDGNTNSQETKKYCILLPEHIVPEATTAEVSPYGRLRIKCVAGESEISDNNC